MLSTRKIQQVETLWAQGLSYREIHARTAVCRETIANIVRGERPDYEALRRARREEQCPRPQPAERCPRCGRRMKMPCRACMTEDTKALGLRPGLGVHAEGFQEPIELKLQDHHRPRYQKVRARRVALERAGVKS